jgi:hypothetical protein
MDEQESQIDQAFPVNFMSHSLFTNLGSNQDADSYRDQAIDREREDLELAQSLSERIAKATTKADMTEILHFGILNVGNDEARLKLRQEWDARAIYLRNNPYPLGRWSSKVSIFAAVLFLLTAASASADVKRSLVTIPSTNVCLLNRQLPTKADAFLFALGELESGNNDFAQGKAGEISRYQCLKSVWREATALPFFCATNPLIAADVVRSVIWQRTAKDIADLTPKQFAVAWHCPNAKHLNREQRGYVRKFQSALNK